MTLNLHREIEGLKQKILTLSAMVEERVRMAFQSLIERDADLAATVIDQDVLIDDMEVEVEEECLKVLALYQPVAIDLRYIVAIIKINNNLERVGDQAVNIAQRAIYLAGRKRVEIPRELYLMAEKAQEMLKCSLDALVNMDQDMAVKVCVLDDEVDSLQDKVFADTRDAILGNPDIGGEAVSLLLVSRHLERIADHATNIAEDVVYLVEGEIVRHGGKGG